MKIHVKLFVFCALAWAGAAFSARADLFSSYEFTGNTFTVPTSAYDVSGGAIYYFNSDTFYRQDGLNANSFTAVGHLGSGFSVNSFPAFVEFSPDGSRVAIGNNGGADFSTYQVAVFDALLLNASNPDLAGAASIYNVNHNSASWADNRNLLLTAGVFGSPSVVTSLDTLSPTAAPVNGVVVNNIGGASAGVALDASGNLFTGNGFDGAGTSDTGWIKAILQSTWQTNPPADFENSPSSLFVADLLSANSLAFDSEGNLLVGGGDFGSGDLNYFALISSSALNNLLTGGAPINVNDPNMVRRFDPSAEATSFYSLAVDRNNNFFYILDGSTAFQFASIPEPTGFALMLLAVVLAVLRVLARTPGKVRSALTRQGPGLRLAISIMASTFAMVSHADQFFAEEVVNFSPGAGVTEGVGYGISSRVLGGPRGGGLDQAGVDVLSLGETGSVTLGFRSKWIEDGPGFDFIIFENPFTVGGNPDLVFGELVFVEVSTDGTNFARFDSLSLNAGPISPFGTLNKNFVSGLAGTQPVLANVVDNTIDPFDPSTAGGNAFDLSLLSENPLVAGGQVNLSQVRYIRLVDIKGDGLTIDSSGNPIYDATGADFLGSPVSADIDAVSVIHGIPEPGSMILLAGALALLAPVIIRKRLVQNIQ